ncbi:MAG: hypothetical protein U9P42_00485 [Candidatus Fermentibacteria bacterium]|nr:hypothetical protein [Candidatus Fermentibacteria bacterium]
MMTVFLLGLALTGSPTNLDMLETVVFDALEPIAEQVSAHGLEVVTLNVQGEHEGGWLIEQIATVALSQAGVTVYTTRSDDGWMLNLRPMELGVTYAQTRRSWLLGGKQVPRLASCELAATLVDSSGNVVLTVRQGSVIENAVPISDVVIIESSTERWVNGELSEEESGNILEPLVVTGVVTALVYLFYSSRN